MISDPQRFQLDPAEASAAAKGFEQKDALLGTGLKFEGDKYFVLQADEERVIGKKAGNGFTMRAWYRAETPFVANVSLVADFDKTVIVGSGVGT